MLRDEGRRSAETFLEANRQNIGKRSSIDLDVLLEQV
jgi:NTE family protein